MITEFMQEVLNICQEAIDGGYSKTKHIGVLQDPATENFIEFRGDDAKDVMKRMMSNYPELTNGVICKQRVMEDERYVIYRFDSFRGMLTDGEVLVYPIPLDPEHFFIV